MVKYIDVGRGYKIAISFLANENRNSKYWNLDLYFNHVSQKWLGLRFDNSVERIWAPGVLQTYVFRVKSIVIPGVEDASNEKGCV